MNKHLLNLVLEIGDNGIKLVNGPKYLGAQVDCFLSWNQLIANSCMKVPRNADTLLDKKLLTSSTVPIYV